MLSNIQKTKIKESKNLIKLLDSIIGIASSPEYSQNHNLHTSVKDWCLLCQINKEIESFVKKEIENFTEQERSENEDIQKK